MIHVMQYRSQKCAHSDFANATRDAIDKTWWYIIYFLCAVVHTHTHSWTVCVYMIDEWFYINWMKLERMESSTLYITRVNLASFPAKMVTNNIK